MTKHFHVILWVPLLFCALFCILWIRIYANEVIEFEHYVLEKQINYATDSAVEAMLVNADLDPDYSSSGYMRVDPQLAIEDLAHTLCLNFGYLPTDTAVMKILNDNIKAVIVAGFDGYYYFSHQNTDDQGGHELTQSPKIPYFYRNGDYQYCLTFDHTYGYYGELNGSTFKLHNKGYYPSSLIPSKDLQGMAINNAIADTINWCLMADVARGLSQVIELPNTAENLRNQSAISSSTIIAVIEGDMQSFATAVVADGIGGSAVVSSDKILGYTIKPNSRISYLDSNGATQSAELPVGTWYAYESWWETHPPLSNGDAALRESPKYFDSVFDAAKSGYGNLSLMWVE